MELYDEIPYPPLTHSATHPDRLAVIGRLMGLQPARPDACRVLDLGTGNGANIIAMAELLPGSHFVGLDISQPQIEDGQRMVAQLGLTNVDLQAVDVMDLPDAYGSFDYVIAHGFYSWVPQPVRDKGLRLIEASLAPQGIAFVSFNALPGWHQLAALRDLMRYRTRDIEEPLQRAQAARDGSGAGRAQTEDSPFAAFVQQYHSSFQGRGPVPESQLVSTLLHDELSEINQPFYISEFVTAGAPPALSSWPKPTSKARPRSAWRPRWSSSSRQSSGIQSRWSSTSTSCATAGFERRCFATRGHPSRARFIERHRTQRSVCGLPHETATTTKGRQSHIGSLRGAG